MTFTIVNVIAVLENSRSLYERYAPQASTYANEAVPDGNRFRCPICSKTVSWRYTLLEHMTVHTKEKPFRYSFCAAEFTRRDTLVKHLYRAHPDMTCTNINADTPYHATGSSIK
ncbi:hypothetical protein DPMN_021577 [Dreissena polymorpha]|uniref:C2H2-type domain-containing protein n=1 Tax=Dreissena polymorpha TaxID=45954 RepID=A0A9D4S995_DREPO|nr:hypothetical protein DPMN_021577 [Dreissena polymorpha]